MVQGVASVPGVAAAHDLHVWSLTSGVNAVSVHAVPAEGASRDDVPARVQRHFTSSFKIAHVTMQVEGKVTMQVEGKGSAKRETPL